MKKVLALCAVFLLGPGLVVAADVATWKRPIRTFRVSCPWQTPREIKAHFHLATGGGDCGSATNHTFCQFTKEHDIIGECYSTVPITCTVELVGRL